MLDAMLLHDPSDGVVELGSKRGGAKGATGSNANAEGNAPAKRTKAAAASGVNATPLAPRGQRGDDDPEPPPSFMAHPPLHEIVGREFIVGAFLHLCPDSAHYMFTANTDPRTNLTDSSDTTINLYATAVHQGINAKPRSVRQQLDMIEDILSWMMDQQEFGSLAHDQDSLDATFQVYLSRDQRNIKPAELWNDPVTLPRLDIVFRDEPNNIHAKVSSTGNVAPIRNVPSSRQPLRRHLATSRCHDQRNIVGSILRSHHGDLLRNARPRCPAPGEHVCRWCSVPHDCPSLQ